MWKNQEDDEWVGRRQKCARQPVLKISPGLGHFPWKVIGVGQIEKLGAQNWPSWSSGRELLKIEVGIVVGGQTGLTWPLGNVGMEGKMAVFTKLSVLVQGT